MPPTSNWYDGLPPVVVEVPCGRALHQIVWRDGVLRAPEHGDVEAEQTLVALGADVSACLAIVDAWRWGLREGVTAAGPVPTWRPPSVPLAKGAATSTKL